MAERSWSEFDRYMVVAAHPDDAEFSSGGTLAALATLGKEITLVQVTSGDKGSSDADVSPERLAEIREAEVRDAAPTLGIGEIEFLRCRDGELTPDLELRERIVRSIRTYQPDVVISHDPFRPYALHPDHRAVGFAVLDAVYPTARDPHYFPEHLRAGLQPHKVAEIWFFNAEEPDLFVDIEPTFDRKLAALRAHVSQVGTGDVAFPRVRDRAAELGLERGLSLAEAFKVVQLRR